MLAEELAFELGGIGAESIIVEPGGFPTEGLPQGTSIAFAADQDVAAGYGDLAAAPQQVFAGMADGLARQIPRTSPM
jgi:hypothetical protein